MPAPANGDNAAALAAIAAITGQSVDGTIEMCCAIEASAPQQVPASAADIVKAVDRLCTRIGLAPALAQREREQYIRALRALSDEEATSLTLGDLHAWDQVLRSTPEKVPTIEREPVVLPPMSEHQEAMWAALMDFEETDPRSAAASSGRQSTGASRRRSCRRSRIADSSGSGAQLGRDRPPSGKCSQKRSDSPRLMPGLAIMG